METVINDPAGAHRVVSDYRLGKDADGYDLTGPQDIYYLRADAAITKGQALMLVVPTQTVPVSVAPMTAAAEDAFFIGVALESAAAGAMVAVLNKGFARVLFDASDTAAAGDYLVVPATTTGRLDVIGAVAANAVVVGLMLGAEDGTTDTVYAYIDASGLAVGAAVV